MSVNTINTDIVIVGAGTAGTATAYFLARQGRSVILLEQTSLSSAGARWLNGVPPWFFDHVELPRPNGKEAINREVNWLFQDPFGHKRLETKKAPVWGVHIGTFNQRLHRLAIKEDVRIFEHCSIKQVELQNDRPQAITFTCQPPKNPAETFRINAKLFVDASGKAQALLRKVPSLDKSCPKVGIPDTCSAAQQLCQIKDELAATKFLKDNHLKAGQVFVIAGQEGGFSTSNIHVSKDFQTVDLLCGSIADGNYLDGPKMLAKQKQDHKWIGRVLVGGQGLIYLRRPYDRLIAPGIALVGESGCMVFPLHGSGIGSSLLAAHYLAKATAKAEDPGSIDTLWAYQASFQRKIGALHAASDILRRFVQDLGPDQISKLFNSGFLNPELIRISLDQRLSKSTGINPLKLTNSIVHNPLIVARFTPVIARALATYFAYKTYPKTPSIKKLTSWSRQTAKLAGWTPDLLPIS
jgi:flavin-dependent dehydrogenase